MYYKGSTSLLRFSRIYFSIPVQFSMTCCLFGSVADIKYAKDHTASICNAVLSQRISSTIYIGLSFISLNMIEI